MTRDSVVPSQSAVIGGSSSKNFDQKAIGEREKGPAALSLTDIRAKLEGVGSIGMDGMGN